MGENWLQSPLRLNSCVNFLSSVPTIFKFSAHPCSRRRGDKGTVGEEGWEDAEVWSHQAAPRTALQLGRLAILPNHFFLLPETILDSCPTLSVASGREAQQGPAPGKRQAPVVDAAEHLWGREHEQSQRFWIHHQLMLLTGLCHPVDALFLLLWISTYLLVQSALVQSPFWNFPEHEHWAVRKKNDALIFDPYQSREKKV
jgi:hypothetical protein